jgi:hypothetical protein
VIVVGEYCWGGVFLRKRRAFSLVRSHPSPPPLNRSPISECRTLLNLLTSLFFFFFLRVCVCVYSGGWVFFWGIFFYLSV